MCILMKSMIYTDTSAVNESGYGQLYITATPIGNLGDMSPRAVEVLKSVDLIAAEDTRNSIKLLNHFEIKTPMTSYHEYNRFDKADELVSRMLQGTDVAVITDAGTPCISDPGEVLVQKCIEAGITVTSVPGPSAVITALTLSGFSVRRFVFEGFLPPKQKKRDRKAAIERIKDETGTIVLYEAPHRLIETLNELSDIFGRDRRIALCREMTKKHEEVIRTTIGEAAKTTPKGEYVLVIEGKDLETLSEEKQAAYEDMSLEEHLNMYTDKGMDRKAAMKAVAADRGLSKRDVYNALEHGTKP